MRYPILHPAPFLRYSDCSAWPTFRRRPSRRGAAPGLSDPFNSIRHFYRHFSLNVFVQRIPSRCPIGISLFMSPPSELAFKVKTRFETASSCCLVPVPQSFFLFSWVRSLRPFFLECLGVLFLGFFHIQVECYFFLASPSNRPSPGSL